jgi:hypothetical protein
MAIPGPLPPSDEARLQHMAQLEPSGGSAGVWARWVTFASVVLVLLGCLNGFQGFLAMLDDGYFVAQGRELALVSYDAWGAILVFWGAVLLVLGAALNARFAWARWAAAIVVMLDVVIQVGFFPSAPLLALILIALDVMVLYALTVRWDEARVGGI